MGRPLWRPAPGPGHRGLQVYGRGRRQRRGGHPLGPTVAAKAAGGLFAAGQAIGATGALAAAPTAAAVALSTAAGTAAGCAAGTAVYVGEKATGGCVPAWKPCLPCLPC